MEYKVINEGDASTNLTSTGMDVDGLPARPKTLGVQVITEDWTGTGTVKVQHSNVDEDAYYEDIENATFSISSGDDSQILTPFVDIGMKYYRAKSTNATNNGGSLTVSFNFN